MLNIVARCVIISNMTSPSRVLRQIDMSGNSNSPGKARVRGSPLSAREEEYLEKLISLYFAHLRGTHGFAESTIKSYAGSVRRAVRHIGLPPWSWQPQHIDLLLSDQAVRGLVPGTQMLTITALRGLQNYLVQDLGLCNEIHQHFGFRPQRYITSENSIPYRRRGRQRSKVTTPLTPEQCAGLLAEYQYQIDVARQRRTKSYQPLRRDYAITVLALSYGLRADEISGIELGHFISDRKYPQFARFAVLRVIGKGSKERAIRLYAPAAAEVLTWYIDHVRPAFLTKRTTNPNLLFLSERGCSLCHRQYRRSLASVAVAAGLPMRVYPHLLRHTYATEMAQIIGPAALQQQLGHEHLSTTLGTYYHQDPERVGNEVLLGIEALTNAFDEITHTPDKDASDANVR